MLAKHFCTAKHYTSAMVSSKNKFGNIVTVKDMFVPSLLASNSVKKARKRFGLGVNLHYALSLPKVLPMIHKIRNGTRFNISEFMLLLFGEI